ncbi:MAG: hypothetical protein ACPG4K_08795 [Haloferula sp.]
MMFSDFPIASDLFWLFYNLGTGVIMIWIGLVFRSIPCPASRAVLISAIVDFPLSFLSNLYWSTMGWGFHHGDNARLETLDTIISNLDTLMFSVWIISVLFVGFRMRQEHNRLKELQAIANQRIESSHDPGQAGH